MLFSYNQKMKVYKNHISQDMGFLLAYRSFFLPQGKELSKMTTKRKGQTLRELQEYRISFFCGEIEKCTLIIIFSFAFVKLFFISPFFFRFFHSFVF